MNIDIYKGISISVCVNISIYHYDIQYISLSKSLYVFPEKVSARPQAYSRKGFDADNRCPQAVRASADFCYFRDEKGRKMPRWLDLAEVNLICVFFCVPSIRSRDVAHEDSQRVSRKIRLIST